MLTKNRIITLLVVTLLAACAAAQAKPIGWTFYWTDDKGNPSPWAASDLVIDWNWGSTSSVMSFQFQIQADPSVGPMTSAVPFAPFALSPIADLGGGLYQVAGSAQGTLPPPGDANLADFIFTNPFPEGAPFTMSLGPNDYFVLVDSQTGAQTTLGPNDVDPLTVYAPPLVPEPSSIVALLGGFGALLAFRRRRA